MEQGRLEETLKALDSEAGSGERRAYIDPAGGLLATPAALYAVAADMLRAANNRPPRYITGDEAFWAGGVVGLSGIEVRNEPVDVDREAFRKERLSRLGYAIGVVAFVGFALFFLYLFFWWFMAQ
jgi:hypothetical protein